MIESLFFFFPSFPIFFLLKFVLSLSSSAWVNGPTLPSRRQQTCSLPDCFTCVPSPSSSSSSSSSSSPFAASTLERLQKVLYHLSHLVGGGGEEWEISHRVAQKVPTSNLLHHCFAHLRQQLISISLSLSLSLSLFLSLSLSPATFAPPCCDPTS